MHYLILIRNGYRLALIFQVVSSLIEDNTVLVEEVSKTIQQSFNTFYDKVEESIATKGIEAKRDSYKLKLYEYIF